MSHPYSHPKYQLFVEFMGEDLNELTEQQKHQRFLVFLAEETRKDQLARMYAMLLRMPQSDESRLYFLQQIRRFDLDLRMHRFLPNYEEIRSRTAFIFEMYARPRPQSQE